MIRAPRMLMLIHLHVMINLGCICILHGKINWYPRLLQGVTWFASAHTFLGPFSCDEVTPFDASECDDEVMSRDAAACWPGCRKWYCMQGNWCSLQYSVGGWATLQDSHYRYAIQFSKYINCDSKIINCYNYLFNNTLEMLYCSDSQLQSDIV